MVKMVSILIFHSYPPKRCIGQGCSSRNHLFPSHDTKSVMADYYLASSFLSMRISFLYKSNEVDVLSIIDEVYCDRSKFSLLAAAVYGLNYLIISGLEEDCLSVC